MARLINAEVMGFFATPPSVTALVAAWFTAPPGDKPWRLLDPCCGEGVAAAQLAAALGGSAQTWGVELSPKRAEQAAQRLDKVLNTAWQATRVSKAAVSLLWLNPPYDHDLDGDHKRLEIEFLRTALPTLVPGGDLVFIVPQHLLGYLSNSTCRWCCGKRRRRCIVRAHARCRRSGRDRRGLFEAVCSWRLAQGVPPSS